VEAAPDDPEKGLLVAFEQQPHGALRASAHAPHEHLEVSLRVPHEDHSLAGLLRAPFLFVCNLSTGIEQGKNGAKTSAHPGGGELGSGLLAPSSRQGLIPFLSLLQPLPRLLSFPA
jgi:hypothetical protein